jgi:hypothetical protein
MFGGGSFGNYTQFFKPISSAEFCPQTLANISYKLLAVEKPPEDYPYIYDTTGYCNGEWLPQSPPQISLFNASKFVWRFNTETRKKIEEILSQFPNWSSRKYYALHIRRGDKNYGHWREAEYTPTLEFIDYIEKQGCIIYYSFS